MHVLCNLLSAPVVKVSPVLYSKKNIEVWCGLLVHMLELSSWELLLVHGCSCSNSRGKA